MNAPALDWVHWQLADSAFPTGGFAHSGGLEAACHAGEIRGREDLEQFLEAAIAQAGRASLPYVGAAFDQAEPLESIDALCDAFTSNHVANRASRLQGRAFLNSADRAFSNAEIRAIAARDFAGHFAPLFGAVARALGLERNAVLRLFLFTQLRGWISSAVRLNVVGPIEAQGIQARFAPAAEEAVLRASHCTLSDIAQTAPLLDLFQGAQDRLYSRLFQS